MLLSAAFIALTLTAPPDNPKPFEFKDGDRVVWIGNTLVEREQRYGYWETALIAANADKKITFRNLGWSGDTVHAEARGRFDFNNPDKCFKQLVDQTVELKPTVIFVSYGTNESFEGKGGLPKFEKGLEKLLDALKPTNARVVLFTPVPAIQHKSLPNAAVLNDQFQPYVEAIVAVGKKRGLWVADLFAHFDDLRTPGDFTENGLHYTAEGYKHFAPLFRDALVSQPTIDWEKLEPMRKAIVAKNEQFFNKWRPQNETYLTGFRKHEQGKNAKEVAEFDPFIEKAEAEIEKLRKGLK